MKLETLLAIKTESERFNKRLDAAIKTAVLSNCDKCEYNYTASALKRASLDLKGELTKITSPKY